MQNANQENKSLLECYKAQSNYIALFDSTHFYKAVLKIFSESKIPIIDKETKNITEHQLVSSTQSVIRVTRGFDIRVLARYLVLELVQ